MKYKVEGRKVVNIVLIIACIAVLFTNLFAESLSKLLYLKPDYEFKNQTEIHFISVGQGDAIAIKFDNGKIMLIDSGIKEYRKNLENYLDNILLGKDKTIDYLVLTHIDIDHSGNMQFLLENYKVSSFYRPFILSTIEDETSQNSSYVYDNIIAAAMANNVNLKFNKAGVSLTVGNNILTWLAPIDIENKENPESNEFSAVIRLDYNNHSVLFTGDISDDIEQDLISTYSYEMLDVDILKLPHHGSAYSNSTEFLEATSPDFACVCVGENTYGHPANKTLERILEYDSQYDKSLYNNLYSTDDDNNVIFTLSNQIGVQTIVNINNYSFVSYYIYSIIVVVLLLIVMLTPYFKVYLKNRRFIKQNQDFEKNSQISSKQQK